MIKRTEYLDRMISKEEIIGRADWWYENLFRNLIDKARSKNGYSINIIRFWVDTDAWNEIVCRCRSHYDVQNMYIYGIPVYLSGDRTTSNRYRIRLEYEREYDDSFDANATMREYWSADALVNEQVFMKNLLNNIYGLGTNRRMIIRKVIFNDPATIVYWQDGSKTVVKCQEGDTFDKEKGLAMAISKRALGTNESQSDFNDIFKKWITEEELK